ncbi:MAG: sigma-70 family RNA polymerase sigma factor [Acidobacteriia bacterium]|nr:sigma-70 family RNA polymerase sigma factor [Terriglobia bacterium]
MTGTATGRAPERPDSTADERLIGLCLKGDSEAWAALIDKYKNLIYSIPIKLGMHQDAGDIFQSVCVDLLSELPRLREHRALPKWLMQTCYHKCLHHQRAADRLVELEPEGTESDAPLPAGSNDELPEHMLVQIEQEQMLRDAIGELPERCERMVRLLFYEIPPRPYEDVAEELGMATGSIGAIRARCLAYLKKHLEKRGF